MPTDEIEVKGYRVKRGLLYTREHEWITTSEEEASIGITDYAQKLLHEIVFVELPEIGTYVKKGESIGVVESIKAISDVYSPASGTIVEVNEELSEKPELLNADPYLNWIVKIRLEDPEELNQLMDADAYSKYVAELEQ